MSGTCRCFFMRTVATLFINFSIFITAVTVNDGSTALIQPLLNLTGLALPIVPVDRRFTVEGFFSADPIDELSCLMVGVATMAGLAMLNWLGDTRAFQTDQLSKYPLVYLDMVPEPPLVEVPNRFLVWGLGMALRQYIARERFDESVFYLDYAGRRIATLYFFSTLSRPPSSLAAMDGQTEHNRSLSNKAVNVSNVLDLETTAQSRTVIEVLPNAQSLHRRIVFLAIYATLKAVAFPRTTSISAEGFQIGPIEGKAIVVRFTSSDGPHLPERDSPELQYGWIIETLRVVPEWMIDHGFKEIEIGIYVGNTLVGLGSVKKGEMPELSRADGPGTLASIS